MAFTLRLDDDARDELRRLAEAEGVWQQEAVIAADAAVSGNALVRDHGLLISALARPKASFGGQDAYPDVDEKAAALLLSLVDNYALVDGNKRLGWLATYTFYAINEMTLDAPTDEAYDLVIGVAEGDVDVPEIAERLSGWR